VNRPQGRPHCPDCDATPREIDQYLTAGVGDDVVRLCHCLKCGTFFKAGPHWEILTGNLDEISEARRIAKDRRIPGGPAHA
jgi:uncharacterized protein with PIN domain